jgi:hypothetical protein
LELNVRIGDKMSITEEEISELNDLKRLVTLTKKEEKRHDYLDNKYKQGNKMNVNKEVIERLEQALFDMPEGGVRTREIANVREVDLRLVLRYLDSCMKANCSNCKHFKSDDNPAFPNCGKCELGIIEGGVSDALKCCEWEVRHHV